MTREECCRSVVRVRVRSKGGVTVVQVDGAEHVEISIGEAPRPRRLASECVASSTEGVEAMMGYAAVMLARREPERDVPMSIEEKMDYIRERIEPAIRAQQTRERGAEFSEALAIVRQRIGMTR